MSTRHWPNVYIRLQLAPMLWFDEIGNGLLLEQCYHSLIIAKNGSCLEMRSIQKVYSNSISASSITYRNAVEL